MARVPSASSTVYTGPVTVSKSATLSAIATASGFANSGVASASFVIGTNTAAPVISPAGGTFSAAQSVTITDATSGASIYYTTDGSQPSSASTPYSAPIAVSATETINAIAIASGNTSSVTTATFTINIAAAALPTFSPAAGTYTSAQTVSLGDTTPGAAIYYTVDGSQPTTSSPQYSGPITVSASETIKAIATAAGFGSSAVASAAYTINATAAAPPTFSPAAGTYTSAQTVIINDTTPSATIYYTVDGSMPTTSSPQYGNPITVSTSETIKAIATASGFGTSAVASAAYTISGSVAQPTFSPAAGTYTSAQSVTLSDATPGATIYYTVDGSPATTSSTLYNPSTPIAVPATATINAIAAVGNDTSTMASALYTLNLGPTFNGKVFSGTLPVNGAQVQMYAAGQTDYGSAATALLTTPATTGSDGKFSLPLNCPAAPGDLVYLIASGGSTGNGGANAGSVLMAAIGSCNGTLPATVVVNEVTTVASVYALSQFMTGAANVGSSASNYEKGATSAPGLANAFATVTNLVDLTTGQALDHTPAYPTNLAGDPNILNNSTVPQKRINTLANILNACAVDGTGCSTLFSAATPASGTAPADTLQAILNIAQNPGNNAGMVYNITAGSGPFTPVLSAAPNDWTLALTFTGGGLGFAPGVPVSYSNGSAITGQFLNTAMAIDATGDIWVTGFNLAPSGGFPDYSSGMIAAFSNLGAPLTPPSSLSSGSSPVATFGGYIPIKGGDNGGTVAPHSIAFDPSGNAWISGGSHFIGHGAAGAVSEVSPALSLTVTSMLGTENSSQVAIDGLGHVWAQGSNGLQELDSNGGLLLGPDPGVSQDGIGSPYGYGSLQSLVFDSNGTSLWASDATTPDFFLINPANDTATFDYFQNGGRNTLL